MNLDAGVVAFVTIALAVGAAVGGVLVAALLSRTREGALEVFQQGNAELRQQLTDARTRYEDALSELQERGSRMELLESEMGHLRELVTQKAAVAELAGFVAESRRQASSEHAQLIAAIRELGTMLGDRRDQQPGGTV